MAWMKTQPLSRAFNNRSLPLLGISAGERAGERGPSLHHFGFDIRGGGGGGIHCPCGREEEFENSRLGGGGSGCIVYQGTREEEEEVRGLPCSSSEFNISLEASAPPPFQISG